jgi:hypothetical protein
MHIQEENKLNTIYKKFDRNEGGIMMTFDCHWTSTKFLNP